MTDEEGEYRDDYFTRNPPKVDPAKNRILTGEGPVARMTRHDMALNNCIALDSDVMQYICVEAAATGETRSQVASAIIRREQARSA